MTTASKRVEVKTLGENPTVEDLRQFSAEVHGRFKELDALEAKGRLISPEEWDTANQALAELSARVGQHEAAIKLVGSRVPTWGDDETIGTRMNALFEVPDDQEFRGVNKAYFNLMNGRSEELLGLTQIDERYLPGVDKRVLAMLSADSNAAFAARHKRLQQVNDILVLKYAILSAGKKSTVPQHPLELMRTFREWDEWVALTSEKEFGRALETTNPPGSHLMPTLLSNQMADKVEATLRVAALFGTIPMRSKTYDWPVLSSHLTYFVVPEATSDTAAAPTGFFSTPGTTLPRWTLSKFLGFCVLSSEATEDTLIPALPFVQNEMTASAAHAIEEAMIDGDTGTSLDGATYNPANSAKRGWNGFRYYNLVTGSYPAKIDNVASNSGDLALNSIDAQAAMGEWGVNPELFAWIAGFKAYHKLRKHADYRTMDKIDKDAATRRGQVGVWEGSPVILSAKVNLQKSTGVYGDGTARTFGSLIGVRTDRFIRGIGPGIDVETSKEERFTQDQLMVKGRFRQDFEPLDTPSATVTPTCIVYDIA